MIQAFLLHSASGSGQSRPDQPLKQSCGPWTGAMQVVVDIPTYPSFVNMSLQPLEMEASCASFGMATKIRAAPFLARAYRDCHHLILSCSPRSLSWFGAEDLSMAPVHLPSVDADGYIHGSGAPPLCRRPAPVHTLDPFTELHSFASSPPPSPPPTPSPRAVDVVCNEGGTLSNTSQQMKRRTRPPPVQTSLQPPQSTSNPRTSDATLKDIINCYAGSQRSVSIRSRASGRSPSSPPPSLPGSNLPSPLLSGLDVWPLNAQTRNKNADERDVSSSDRSKRSLIDIDEHGAEADVKDDITPPHHPSRLPPPPPPSATSERPPLASLDTDQPSRPRGRRKRGKNIPHGSSKSTRPPTTPQTPPSKPVTRKPVPVSRTGPLTLFPPSTPSNPSSSLPPSSGNTARYFDSPDRAGDRSLGRNPLTPKSFEAQRFMLQNGVSVFEDDEEGVGLMDKFKWKAGRSRQGSLDKVEVLKTKRRSGGFGRLFGCCFGKDGGTEER